MSITIPTIHSSGGGDYPYYLEVDGTLYPGKVIDATLHTSIAQLFLPFNFYKGAAVIYNNEIHILGGTGSNYGHYAYDGSSWREVSRLPYSFYEGTAVVWNNEIHLLGGNLNPYTQHYSWNGTEWSMLSPIPYVFAQGCAIVYNNELHILGGYSQSGHYKWNGTSWTSVSTLPYNFGQGSTVVYNDNIYIMGGAGYQRTYAIYNGTSWIQHTNELPSAYQYQYGAAVIYDGKIHIMGGGTAGYGSMHYTYNGTTWENAYSMPYPLIAGSAVVYDNEIHILGGSNNPTYHYKGDGASQWSYPTHRVLNTNMDLRMQFDNGMTMYQHIPVYSTPSS